MSITREQVWKRMEELHTDLYHTGKNYCSSIVGGKNGNYDDCYYSIQNIIPKDKNEHKILDYATIMIMIMSKDKTPVNFCKGKFTCSLIYRKGDDYYSEYLFITKRDTQYIFPEEIICKKYQFEPNAENQEKVRISIERRIYSYNQRDIEKKKRCITFEEAEKLDDYLLNTRYFDICSEDIELQKLKYLSGKTVIELTQEQKTELSNYITKTQRPILLYKSPSDSKLLVNEIPLFQTASYKELCDILIDNKEECSYCKCIMTFFNTKYSETALTFDAVISLYGHRKDNITLCCSLCNSKKTFKNKLDI
jgi:5-methylcytosine-specific restriction endonuclease McrA